MCCLPCVNFRSIHVIARIFIFCALLFCVLLCTLWILSFVYRLVLFEHFFPVYCFALRLILLCVAFCCFELFSSLYCFALFEFLCCVVSLLLRNHRSLSGPGVPSQGTGYVGHKMPPVLLPGILWCSPVSDVIDHVQAGSGRDQERHA